MIGYQMGVIEAMSDSMYEFEEDDELELKEMKQSLIKMVSRDIAFLDDTNYETLMSRILEGYKKVDLEFFSCILIGLCYERYLSKDIYKDSQKIACVEAAAEEALKEIPSDIIMNADRLFMVLKLFCAKRYKLETVAEIVNDLINKTKEKNQKEAMEKRGYVFISYSSKNQAYAEATRKLLIEENIKSWMAPYDIPAGSKYAHVINDAIENCGCVLLLLSEEAQQSEFVEREIERAITYK